MYVHYIKNMNTFERNCKNEGNNKKTLKIICVLGLLMDIIFVYRGLGGVLYGFNSMWMDANMNWLEWVALGTLGSCWREPDIILNSILTWH